MVVAMLVKAFFYCGSCKSCRSTVVVVVGFVVAMLEVMVEVSLVMVVVGYL